MITSGRTSPRTVCACFNMQLERAVLRAFGHTSYPHVQEKRFAFDQAFGADTDNGVLFTATAEPLIGAFILRPLCSLAFAQLLTLSRLICESWHA